jgi:hypothetical protein
MISNPHDRGPVAKAIFKTLGVKTHSIHFSSSSGNIICIIEGNAEQMVQINAILMSSGAFQFIQSEELITTATMNTAMAKAGKAVGKYKAPNA